MRLGSVRALDTEDVKYDQHGQLYLEVRHRPETDTPLKLGVDCERNVTVGDTPLSGAIDDWVQHQRPDVVDKYGRTPLMATSKGRASKRHSVLLAIEQLTHAYSTDVPTAKSGIPVNTSPITKQGAVYRLLAPMRSEDQR